jgi:hypothetical protein
MLTMKVKRSMKFRKRGVALAAALLVCGSAIAVIASAQAPRLHPWMTQSTELVAEKSAGCLSCHSGIEEMHASPAVRLGCIDCHGGNATVHRNPGDEPSGEAYRQIVQQAHVHPLHPERWIRDGVRSSANPERSYTLLNDESPEFVRFVNPGDLRVAHLTCGACHASEVNRVPRSTMATSAVFWAAAAYANGIMNIKRGLFGEYYTADGEPGAIIPQRPLTDEERERGALDRLIPLPRWEITQPGEYFRAFERGGLLQENTPPEIGNPNVENDPGRPDIRLSTRGRGTGLRISPAIINLHKTRLNDPHLSFLGTNDHPGDYRSSGCTACHVVYANDRDPLHSGPWSVYGHRGLSATGDPTIPKNEQGHPIRHRLTRAIPTSQCMSCHMHQPNSFVNTYLGYTMWDYETDAEFLFPREQRYPTAKQRRESLDRNPEGAAVRGLWNDARFLERVSELNSQLRHTQFADYHGHGWVFQAVFKRDRQGRLLDADGSVVSFDDPDRLKKAVHMRDIHIERGMHCVDCHFDRDNHGTGMLLSEYGDSIEIECRDCHGTAQEYTDLRTTGPAAPRGGTNLAAGTTPDGRRRFVWREGRLYQRSMMGDGREWEVIQVRDAVTAGHPRYNEKAARAKTLQRDGITWGSANASPGSLAHSDAALSCDSCHSAWVTNCWGCHLPQEANQKSPMIRYEGTVTRNYASYNPQVIRNDAYMLGVSATRKGNKISPVRSSSALSLSSTNADRQRFYVQQPTISAPGFNGQAFNTHVPHTIRTKETKACSDCHISEANDNNAWMAQLLLQGTNTVNFVGRFAWVGTSSHGPEAVAVTEWEEPQAVIGSYLHRIVYPDWFAQHQRRDRELAVVHRHHGHDMRSIQLRGEYLFTAQEKGGMVVYDVANIDNKDFSERFVTTPVSPRGQRTTVKTRFATSVVLPTNMPMAFNRQPLPENQEQPIHPIYRYAFITDRYEGVILSDVATLTDGDPENNFLSRQLTFNPDGVLTGAEQMTLAGNYGYVVADAGLVVIDFSTPLQPRIVATLPEIGKGRSVAVQFRYAFVAGEDGLSVVDITVPTSPRLAARLPLADARSVYLARTYAYVGGGREGMIIVDITNPERPVVDQVFDDGGRLNDTSDVKVGATNASLFAYVADGKNGLAVVQLTSPERTPAYAGFSPRPHPEVIARRKTKGAALAISKGLDRDRAVDESGNQVAIFNRLGARPMTLDEMHRLYLRNGAIFRVSDDPRASQGSRATGAAGISTPSAGAGERKRR